MNTLEKHKCLVAARTVRNWVYNHRDEDIPDTLEGLCGIASVALFRLLRKHGIEAQIAHNNEHAFVLFKDHVLDVTATQFGEPGIVVFRRMSTCKASQWRIESSFDNDQEFMESQRGDGWPDDQIFNEKWEKLWSQVV